MSFDYSYVLPATGSADNAQVREMFEDVKDYVNNIAAGSIIGTINAGSANRLAYYAGAGNTIDDLAALTGNRALATDASGLPSATGVTNTELGYLSGVTSAVQTQISSKASTALSNLASVAINTGLLPGTSDSISLGSASKFWEDVFVGNDIVFHANGDLGTNILLKAPASFSAYTFTLPTSGGTSGYALVTDGSGTTSWVDLATGANTALSNLASVAVNDHIIPGTDDAVDLGSSTKYWRKLYSNGVQFVENGGAGTNTIFMFAPGTVDASYNFVLPANDGTDGYVLTTDGSGNTSWSELTYPTLTGLAGYGGLFNEDGEASDLYTNAGAYTFRVVYAGLESLTANSTLNITVVNGTNTIMTDQGGLFVGSVDIDTGQYLRLYSLLMRGTTSGTVTIEPAAASTTHTLTLPDDNAAGVLENDGFGGLTWSTGSFGASEQLDNLSSVAVNTDIISDTDNTDSLGSSTKQWAAVYGHALQSGRSGAAGIIYLYPGTASKGRIRIDAADNAGDHTLQLTNASLGQAVTYTFPDVGGNANFVMTAGSQTIAGAKTFSTASVLATGTTVGNLTLANGSITDSSGTISFNNENLTTSGDIYSAASTNYYASSTVVGWSSLTATNIYVKKIGKTVHINFFLQGTSNATTVSFTVPYTCSALTDNFARIIDNGTSQANVGLVEIAGGGTTVNIYKDMTGAAFTNSGNKAVGGSFIYEASS